MHKLLGWEAEVRPNLRALVDDYLRTCDGWREHPAHARTYMQWEDLRAQGDDTRLLPTDLAAVRQMTYEATKTASDK